LRLRGRDQARSKTGLQERNAGRTTQIVVYGRLLRLIRELISPLAS